MSDRICLFCNLTTCKIRFGLMFCFNFQGDLHSSSTKNGSKSRDEDWDHIQSIIQESFTMEVQNGPISRTDLGRRLLTNTGWVWNESTTWQKPAVGKSCSRLSSKWSTISGENKGYWAFAIYSGFKVDDECEQFRLHVAQREKQEYMVGNTDYFLRLNGKIFSTSDKNPSSCTGNGAWWHKNDECRYACFNCYNVVWRYSSKTLHAEMTEMYMRDASRG